MSGVISVKHTTLSRKFQNNLESRLRRQARICPQYKVNKRIMIKVICNKCGRNMKFVGNISGITYTSYPAQWEDTYICESCKEKKTVREHGISQDDYSFIKKYPEQT